MLLFSFHAPGYDSAVEVLRQFSIGAGCLVLVYNGIETTVVEEWKGSFDMYCLVFIRNRKSGIFIVIRE